MNTDQMSQEDIENVKIELHKRLAESLRTQAQVNDHLNTLKQQKIALRKQQTDLEAEMHKYKSTLDKSRYNNAAIRQDIKELEGKFWQRKDGM